MKAQGSLHITLMLIVFAIIVNVAMIDYFNWLGKSCGLTNDFQNISGQFNASATGGQTLENYYANYGQTSEQCRVNIATESLVIVAILDSVILIGIARGLFGLT